MPGEPTERPSQKLTLTVAEAGRLLGISRGLAYEAARAGYLPTIRLGRRILVSRPALERLIDTGFRYNSQVKAHPAET